MKKFIAVLLTGVLVCFSTGCSTLTKFFDKVEANNSNSEIIASNRLEAIKQADKLVIGISPDYAPFAFQVSNENEETQYAGSDIELGKYISEKMGVTVEFMEMDFEDSLHAVKEGEVDMVLLGMLPDPNRLAYVDFTEPYYQPGKQVLITTKEQAENYTELEDFAGKKIAAQYGSLQAQLIVENLTDSYLELTDTAEEGAVMLNDGKVDALLLDEAMVSEILKQHYYLTESKCTIDYSQEGVVGGVIEREPELLEKINEIIEEVNEESLYYFWLDQANSQAAKEITPIEPQPESDKSSQAVDIEQ